MSNEKQKSAFNRDLDKMRHYCGYQERCFYELREKAKKIELSFDDLERMIPILESEHFYSEARFAEQYAGGKFRMKKWGRYKIRKELRSKQVPKSLIDNAIDKIPEDAYLETLRELMKRKNREYGNKPHQLYAKLYRFFTQKGYESHLFRAVFNELFPKKN